MEVGKRIWKGTLQTDLHVPARDAVPQERSSSKKTHTYKNVVVTDLGARNVRFLSAPAPGSVHDKTLWVRIEAKRSSVAHQGALNGYYLATPLLRVRREHALRAVQ